jgi:hypothetical protein
VAAGGVLVLAVVGVWVWLGTDDDPGPVLPAALRASLAVEARDTIETGVVPTVASDSGRLACAVKLLGTEPAAVTEVAQVRTIYVWASCATLGTEVRTESSLPVALHLTDPPTAEVPGDGEINTSDKKRIFPKRLWDEVIGDGDSQPLEAPMLQRVAEKS